MTSRLLQGALPLILHVLLGSIALAQVDRYAGQTIVEVRVEGNQALTEEDLLFYFELRPGERYDPDLLNLKIRETWDRDLLDGIEVDVVEVTGGVTVTLKVVERPLLVSIEYEGLKKLKRSDMSELIDSERLDLYEGLYLSKGELARFEAAIENLYEEKGYRFAEASIQIEPVSRFEQRVVVFVDEGSKVKIGKVSFDGNEVFSQGKLRSTMEKTKKSNLITRIRKRDVYNPATFEEDLDRIRELYKNAGYKNLVIGDAQLDVIEKGTDKDGQVKDRKLALIIPLEEGERWSLGEIHVEGNEVLPSELLRSVFKQPKGGWLREDEINAGVEQIQEFYQNSGYMFARVEREIRESGDLIADIYLLVEEGDQFRIGKIEFSGNTKTQDRVLRRNLRVQEGMIFNSGQLKNSLFKLNQLEFFKLHEDEPVDIDIDEENQEVNLTIMGDEAERTEMTFGGGFSEIDGFFIQGGLATRNFLGRGETVGVSLQTGAYREEFNINYFRPWLFDKPQNVGVQIFKRDLDYDLLATQRFIRKEKGITLTYQRVLGAWQNMSLSYTNGEFSDFQSNQPFPELPPIEQSFEFRRSALTASWSVDRRDSRMEATKGRFLRGSLEYSGGILGGDDWMIRPTAQASLFKPFRLGGLTTVAAINIEAGYMVPFGTDNDGDPREIIPLNKYFLGGENSVRGFEYRTIWVRDPETGQSILENGFYQGGVKFLQINLEYQFVVGGPFRVVPFLDAGNVWSDQQEVDLSNMRYSAGVELRVNVPIFGAPLRFIYAENLRPIQLFGLDVERFDSFDFSIGTAF